MSTPTLGAGLAPAGISFAGFGSPAVADVPAGPTPGPCRYIDPTTRDYVLDDTGNATQTAAVQQLVYIALARVTDWPDRLTDDYEARVQAKVAQALNFLTSQNLIEITEITLTIKRRTLTSVRGRVRFKDLSTGTEFTNGF